MNDNELSAFFNKLPEYEKVIALKLYEIIQSHEAKFDCKLSYASLFFFYQKKRLFYLWPASIPWGGVKNGVRLAFIHGYLFHDDLQPYLSFDKRKEIGVIDYTDENQIESNIILRLLTKSIQFV